MQGISAKIQVTPSLKTGIRVTGTALKLSPTEFRHMMSKYISKLYGENDCFNIILDYLLEWLDIYSVSNFAVAKPDSIEEVKKVISLGTINNFSITNLYRPRRKLLNALGERAKDLVVFFEEFNWNPWEEVLFAYAGQGFRCDSIDSGDYLLYTNVATDLPEDFDEKFGCGNLEEVVADFKKSIGGYLPEDFNYPAHIGFFIGEVSDESYLPTDDWKED